MFFQRYAFLMDRTVQYEHHKIIKGKNCFVCTWLWEKLDRPLGALNTRTAFKNNNGKSSYFSHLANLFTVSPCTFPGIIQLYSDYMGVYNVLVLNVTLVQLHFPLKPFLTCFILPSSEGTIAAKLNKMGTHVEVP